jgi:hypothetical protein
MRLSLLLVFLSLVVLSVLTAIIFQLTKKHLWRFTYLAVSICALSLLGLVLVFLTIEQDVGGLLKIFLMMAGFAPIVTIISVISHNIISALLTSILKREFEDAVFFLFALFGCPMAFLIGVIGSITLIIRYKLTS